MKKKKLLASKPVLVAGVGAAVIDEVSFETFEDIAEFIFGSCSDEWLIKQYFLWKDLKNKRH